MSKTVQGEPSKTLNREMTGCVKSCHRGEKRQGGLRETVAYLPRPMEIFSILQITRAVCCIGVAHNTVFGAMA